MRLRQSARSGERAPALRGADDTHNLEPAALYLCREWLPASGEEVRDFPIYGQRFFLDDTELARRRHCICR